MISEMKMENHHLHHHSMPFLSPSLIGQGKVNQLGGSYINGRPLSPAIRRQIVEMYLSNEKPCNISRRLRVSHGAVSKILSRYQETGSIQPGQIGGTARTRKTIVQFSKEIIAMKEENPDIQAKEIRSMLIRNGLCTKDDAPTESSIARKLTAYKREKVAKAKKSSTKKKQQQQQQQISELPDPLLLRQPKLEGSPSLSHSIEHILGASISSNSNIAANIIIDSNNHHQNTSTSSVQSSNDDSYTDDEDQDSSSLNRNENRRNRTAFTTEQIKTLENFFDHQMYPSEIEKQQIIDATGLDLTRINTWFSNRRARVRKSCGISTDLPIPQQQPPQHPILPGGGGGTPTDLFHHQFSMPFPQIPLFPFDPHTALLLLSKLQQKH